VNSPGGDPEEENSVTGPEYRDAYLRTVRFEHPPRILMVYSINGSCWQHYPPEALRELIETHPLLFPEPESVGPPSEFPPFARAGEPFTDLWGCVWESSMDGITGTVTRHPLADWSALKDFRAPDPMTSDGLVPFQEPWEQIAGQIREAKAAGRLTVGGLVHGHTFLRLCDLRGYENLIMDMAAGEPRLDALIEQIREFNCAVLRRYSELGVDMLSLPEDLGMQFGPMLTPAHFRRYVLPCYERYTAIAREGGCLVHMHSDGDIRALADDLVSVGVEILNLQDLVNGVDWIAERFGGRVCIDLDLDRQKVIPFGTPAQIDALVREAVEKIGTPAGGLMIKHGLYPGVPLENVRATMDAMERYSTYYS
jgi:hypothetical protein